MVDQGQIFPFLDNVGRNFITFLEIDWHYHNSGPKKCVLIVRNFKKNKIK